MKPTSSILILLLAASSSSPNLSLTSAKMFHEQVHMDVAEVSNVDLVVSHHKGFGPDEIDVQRAVDRARMAGKDQKAEYKKFLEEEIREKEILQQKRQR